MVREKGDNKAKWFSRDAWTYFLSLYDGLRTKLLLTTLGSAAQVLLIIPALLLVKYAFDDSIPAGDTRTLIYIGVAILLLRMLNSVATVLIRDVNIKVINKAIFRLRSQMLERLYSLPRSFHTREDPRILHARLVQDTERLTHLSNALISRIFPSVIISAALCVVLLVLNWYLLLAILLLAPLIVFANRVVGRRIKTRVFVFQRVFERFSRGMYFVLRYMDLTAMQSARDKELERQKEVLDDLRDETGSMAYIYAYNAQLQEFLTGLSGIIIIILGGASVAEGWMSIGDFIAFYLAASFLNRHFNNITTAFPDVIAGNESMQTLYGLRSAADQLPYKGSDPHHFERELKISEIEFAYTETPLLNGLDLTISRGDKIAILGANGAGKTTIIHLILGFYKPDRGTLTADGIAYEEIEMEAYRRSIGVVMQTPFVFSASIRENILYGNEDADDTALAEACRISGVDSLVQGFSDKLETEVGEDGVRLSGGERQRIAIARALVRKPSLLILDEPTNNLDTESVDRLMRSLSGLDYDPAVLLISHDRSVVGMAGEVYILKEGKLIPEDRVAEDGE